MENIIVKHISEVIYRLGTCAGMNIKDLSRVSEIQADVVRDILLSIYEKPFGGIILEVEGIGPDEDILEIPEDDLDDRIIWKIDISGMDKIPVIGMEPDERLVLHRLLNGINNNFEEFSKSGTCKSAIFIKGTSNDTDKIFYCKNYFIIRKALVRKKKMAVTLLEDVSGSLSHNIIPLGMVFHSEKQEWYLICMLESGEVRALEMSIIKTARVLEQPGYLKNFDIREYLRHCFDLDSPDAYNIEVVFDNYGNILQKVRRRLSGRGGITVKDDGTFVFRGTLSGIEDFKRWIWGFGSAARVVKPEWLAQEQIIEWRKIVDNYMHMEEIMSGLEE